MNIEVQTILWDSDLSTFEYITRRGIFGSCSISIFNFLSNLHCFLYQLKFTLPSTVCRGSCFSTTYLIHTHTHTHMHTHTYKSYSNRCEVISHCDFDLHFLMISYIQYLFIYLLAICMSCLKKYLLRSFAHFLKKKGWTLN